MENEEGGAEDEKVIKMLRERERGCVSFGNEKSNKNNNSSNS